MTDDMPLCIEVNGRQFTADPGRPGRFVALSGEAVDCPDLTDALLAEVRRQVVLAATGNDLA